MTLTKYPANPATGEVFPDWEPVAVLIIKEKDLLDWISKNPQIDFMIQELKPFKPDLSFDQDWVDLKSKASKAWRELKNHELDLLHPKNKDDGTKDR